MIDATPAIVLKAASIIEQEVAIGIGAAKRIEQRFLDVEALRGRNPDHVMSRFRKDAHDAVDILLDIMTAAAMTVGDRAGRIVNVTASHLMQAGSAEADAPGSAEAAAMRIPAVRTSGTVAPGETATVTMSLENASDATTTEFTLHCSELVSARDRRIPASAVAFEPKTLSVEPRVAGTVTVRVTVPLGTDPGIYEGLLRATQLDELRAMLVVTVA